MPAKTVKRRQKPATQSGPAGPRPGAHAHAAVTPGQIAALLPDWRASLTSEARLADVSVATYTNGVKRLLDWCHDLDIPDISDKTLRAWLKNLTERRYRAGAISTWYAGVRAFFAWAVSHDRLRSDPTERVKSQRRDGAAEAHRRRPLTDTEILRVLSQPNTSSPAGKRDKAILALMCYAALRSVEVHRARRDHLETRGKRLVLKVHGKRRAEATEIVVLAHPDLQEALYDWLAARDAWLAEHWPEERPEPEAMFISLSDRSRGKALSLAAIRRLVKSYFRAAGVRDQYKTTHSLRHSAITSAVEHGAPVQKVQALARHVNIGTTMIYFHESDRLKDPAEDYIDYRRSETKD